ncbi:hypothetical protein F2P45_10335 [Massilia sp. CCM 8733]|uniref:Transposase n=1 Tax=Massilia mucilaginosa TaxID=2609282 RepID=A0ABX0NRI5_9BURK|nr:hypothetical protein [Massilia mucilaginosa]NHZ89410.1 hypothetical protein [Massilia mucilaginosa]
MSLHRKGLAASAFTEHYQGVVNCHRDSRDYPALIDSGVRWRAARGDPGTHRRMRGPAARSQALVENLVMAARRRARKNSAYVHQSNLSYCSKVLLRR